MKSNMPPMDIFNEFMLKMASQEKDYIERLKKKKELWQSFQQIYNDWQPKDKANN